MKQCSLIQAQEKEKMHFSAYYLTLVISMETYL